MGGDVVVVDRNEGTFGEPIRHFALTSHHVDDGSGEYHNIRLTEYQADGTITGRFIINLECSGDDEGFTFTDAERTYISHSEDEESTTAPIVDVMTCKSEMPDWFPESPFIPV
ncbi:MAG: hypothetical protein K5778_10250, partial [Bacteroidaceae bacterium]|nr:hypothetical protein [Bacteroidaceae bacterium]